jgi:hypothetical protein
VAASSAGLNNVSCGRAVMSTGRSEQAAAGPRADPDAADGRVDRTPGGPERAIVAEIEGVMLTPR